MFDKLGLNKDKFKKMKEATAELAKDVKNKTTELANDAKEATAEFANKASDKAAELKDDATNKFNELTSDTTYKLINEDDPGMFYDNLTWEELQAKLSDLCGVKVEIEKPKKEG